MGATLSCRKTTRLVDNILVDTTSHASHPFYFSPDSTIWKINREQVLLLNGARVLLMQIAHPLVAESVYQHSYVFDKPFLRLKRTLDLTLATVFGTVEEVEQAISEIDRVHRAATGQLEIAIGHYPSGTAYNPRNPKLAMWVFATLVEGAIHGYETYIQPLSDADKQAFYMDSIRVAGLFGIKSARIPTTYDGLLDYIDTSIARGDVIVGETARKIAPFIMGQTRWYAAPLAYPISRLTVALLPDPLREQYGYELSSFESTAVDVGLKATRQIVPLLPSPIRYVRAYHRAAKRVSKTNTDS